MYLKSKPPHESHGCNLHVKLKWKISSLRKVFFHNFHKLSGKKSYLGHMLAASSTSPFNKKRSCCNQKHTEMTRREEECFAILLKKIANKRSSHRKVLIKKTGKTFSHFSIFSLALCSLNDAIFMCEKCKHRKRLEMREQANLAAANICVCNLEHPSWSTDELCTRRLTTSKGREKRGSKLKMHKKIKFVASVQCCHQCCAELQACH